MNSLGLSIIMKMGCICARESVNINGKKFYIKDQLGEGGFSTVYLIEDSSTRKKYALKKMICHSTEDQKNALQEVEYCKQIKHQNIIECLDSATIGHADTLLNSTSQVLLVLPYFQRGTLLNFLTMKAKINDYIAQGEIVRMFLQICEAVKCLHEMTPEPLAHRDLKTGNILLTQDGNCILMDLGSVCPARVKVCGSQEAHALQDLASERCSMPYRAPELFNVESYCMIDERSDIWSLGCILYALCFFKSPFDAVYERGDSVALAVLSGNITIPDSSPYDQELHDLILYILKVNSMERPYIYSVIERTYDIANKIEPVV